SWHGLPSQYRSIVSSTPPHEYQRPRKRPRAFVRRPRVRRGGHRAAPPDRPRYAAQFTAECSGSTGRSPARPARVDIVVSADLRTLTRVWMGDVRLAEAVRAGLIRLDGPPSLVRAFPTWLALSSFAGVERVGAAVASRPASR